MHKTISRNRLSTFIIRSAALAIFAGVATIALAAEQPDSTPDSHPAISLQQTLVAPLNLTAPDHVGYSSSVGSTEMAAAETFDLSGGTNMQPPPRRRYGHPSYKDSRTNADGSAKYTFAVGGGFTLPVGGTHAYAGTSWKFQVGGGMNFNKTFGLLLQFDYDDFGIHTDTLNKQLALYNVICPSCNFSQLGGSIHDWSFTLNPIINYYTSDKFGAYAIAGVGFYHKYTQFTTQATGTCFDPYYGYYVCQGDVPVDWYVSNAFGANGGFGFTYKFSRFAPEKLYVEARYVWTNNSPRHFDVSGTTSYFNAFPQASAPTTYIPVTFGIRW